MTDHNFSLKLTASQKGAPKMATKPPKMEKNTYVWFIYSVTACGFVANIQNTDQHLSEISKICPKIFLPKFIAAILSAENSFLMYLL